MTEPAPTAEVLRMLSVVLADEATGRDAFAPEPFHPVTRTQGLPTGYSTGSVEAIR